MPESSDELRVYWMPGCSSCVRVKEFLADLKIPYKSINVLVEPGVEDELRALGASSIPIVARGSDFAFAQSLDDVAQFIGIAVDFNRLPPPVLMDRWFYFLDAAQSLIGDIPDERYAFMPMPDRPRALLDLAFHIFQVPEAFLECVQNGKDDLNATFEAPRPEEVATAEDVVAFGAGMTARLRGWWESLPDRNVDYSVKTFYGMQPMHSLMERSTWHTAQHVRQVMACLEEFDAPIRQKIPRGAYTGLPMPKVIWQ